MNTLKLIGETLITFLVPLLFLIGLILINVATYLGLGLVIGLLVTGITLIVVTVILTIEQNNQQPPTNK